MVPEVLCPVVVTAPAVKPVANTAPVAPPVEYWLVVVYEGPVVVVYEVGPVVVVPYVVVAP